MLKTSYALFLQLAYVRGDYSLVYPLARGTGPLLAVTCAVTFLGERPTLPAVAGTLCIVASIYALTGGHRLLHPDRAHLRGGVLYGLGTGAFIAAYTVWDAHAVADRGIPPLLFDAGTSWISLLVLAPFTWRRRRAIASLWATNRREILTVALLSPAAYVPVLTAMRFTPVSYVAPAREVSMLLAAFLGARLLGERDLRRRLLAAAGMAAGVALLTLG
jgi:drug/metabolite transporter (DMT)-like permease